MKINRLFSIAAATLMMAACSSEDTALNNSPQQGRKVHFTATIAAPGGNAGTRTEYTEVTENKKITVAWKVGDEIALVHDKVMDVVKVKTVNADGSATIDGTITSATDEATVQLVYPAARVSAVNSDGNPEFNEAVSGKLLTQDGTLTYIQNNIDFREGEGQLSVNGTEVTLNAAVDMVSSIAIWKLTLQDDAATPAALAATKVTIKSGSDELASTATIAATSEVYLAVPVVDNKEITIEATGGEDTYALTKEGVTLSSGDYYQSTVNLSKTIVLSTVTTATTIEDGYTVTGTLAANVQISIAAGATVTLDGVTITGENSLDYKWAGITCEGDATIILKDGKTNTVTGFHQNYPGIYVPSEMTLTIKGETAGTGKLTASSNGNGAGIGGRMSMDCGNIEIQGGVITATGSSYAAGIGGANSSTCGSITISGGTVEATGGANAAGIGSGGYGSCGNITISGGTVTATGGANAAGIGSGYGSSASCGDITISGGTINATGGDSAAGIGSGGYGSCGNITISGGTVTATGGYGAAGIGSGDSGTCDDITITTGVTKVTATKGNDAPNSIGAGIEGSCSSVTIAGVVAAISTSPYTYDPNAPALNLQVIGDDGKNYDYASLPGGVTAVAKICYVSGSNGLALALADEGKMNWSTAISTCAAHTPAFTGGTWKLATQDEWNNMITAAGNYTALRDGFTSVGGSNLESNRYWSSTEDGSDDACDYYFDSGDWDYDDKDFGNVRVRACLAF